MSMSTFSHVSCYVVIEIPVSCVSGESESSIKSQVLSTLFSPEETSNRWEGRHTKEENLMHL